VPLNATQKGTSNAAVTIRVHRQENDIGTISIHSSHTLQRVDISLCSIKVNVTDRDKAAKAATLIFHAGI
jgi:hypothetical protein